MTDIDPYSVSELVLYKQDSPVDNSLVDSCHRIHTQSETPTKNCLMEKFSCRIILYLCNVVAGRHSYT